MTIEDAQKDAKEWRETCEEALRQDLAFSEELKEAWYKAAALAGCIVDRDAQAVRPIVLAEFAIAMLEVKAVLKQWNIIDD